MEDDSEIESLIKGGALKESTLRQRKRVAEDFSRYLLETRQVGLSDAIEDISLLEQALIGYFQNLTVGKRQEDGSMEDVVPKRGTLDVFKSHLKVFIQAESNGSLDITNKAKFPRPSERTINSMEDAFRGFETQFPQITHEKK